jgi:hypothetical protein
VVITGDTTVEANETFLVYLSNATGASILDGQATGTITNDDGPTLSINDATVTEGATGTKTMTFTVGLSQAAAVPVTFNVATADGSALAGTDYVASNLAGLTIAAGQLTRTVNVAIRGDATVEPNEALMVHLAAASGATILDGQGIGTILNDDGPTLSIADVATLEGASGTKVLRFTVTLSQAAAEPVTYAIATANGTALAGSDYTARSLVNQAIAAGTLAKVFDVVIAGDTTAEANETFTVNLANATGASLLDARATGTITNDD